EGSHVEHIMFATPNDDDHFMLFTADSYTGPDPDFFTKLAETRPPPVRQDKKEYDHRKHMPFRGSVRHEDIVTQGTQRSIDEREEHLAASHCAVFLLPRTLFRAMERAEKGGFPQGVRSKEQGEEIFKIQSFTGIRPKGIF